MTNPTYEQIEYQFQSDTGTVDGASLEGTLNNGISLGTDTGNKKRIRIQMFNDNSKVSNVTWQWQRENATQGTGWGSITTSSSHVRAVATSDGGGPYDGSACGNILTNRGASFDGDGQVTEDGLAGTYNHASGGYTENVLIFYLVDADVANGNTINIRAVSSEGYTVTYTNTPTLTVVKGTDTSDNQSAYMRGSQAASDNQPAYARGSLPASDQQAAYIAGSLAASDSQLAYTAGTDTAADNQSAYMAGSLDTSDNQPAYVEGIASATDNRPAYMAGVDTSADNQPAYIAGSLDATDNQPAYLEGASAGTNVSDSQAAYVFGGDAASDNQSAYMEGRFWAHREYDDFDDNSRDSTKWDLGSANTATDNASVTALEQNNRLEIQPLSSTAGSNYYGFKSVQLFNLTDSAAFVEVTQVHQATSANTQFRLESGSTDGNYFVGFEVEDTFLAFQWRDNSTTSSTDTTYNSTNHRWWRIRYDEATPDIQWQTSPDGLNWTTQRTVAVSTLTAAGLDLDAMRVHLAAGTYASVSSPSATYFDNYNHHPLVPRFEDFTQNDLLIIEHGATDTVDWDYILWGAFAPSDIIKFNDRYFMYYVGAITYDDPLATPADRALGVATSVDGFNWTKYGSNPIITYTTGGSVEEGVGGSVAIVIGGTIHLYYAAIKDIGGGNVDLDIRYRSSTDGYTFSNDQLIFSSSGNEYMPLAIVHDGTNYHLYIKGPQIGGVGPIRRLSGTSATSLSDQGQVDAANIGKAHGGEQTFVTTDDFVLFVDRRNSSYPKFEVKTIDQTSPDGLSYWLFRYTYAKYSRYTSPTVYYDSANDLWYLAMLMVSAPNDPYNGDIVLRYFGNPIAVDNQLAYVAGSASASDNIPGYLAGSASASSRQASYVEGLYLPLPVTEPWTGSNDDPWRISHWVTDIVE